MQSKITLSIFVIVSLISNLRHSLGFPHGGVQVVTYGEPCTTLHKLPFKVEEAHIPPEKILPLEELVPVKETVHRDSYGYFVDTPLVAYQPALQSYDFKLEVPETHQAIHAEKPAEKPIQYLTGLTSTIDKILVPACQNSAN